MPNLKWVLHSFLMSDLRLRLDLSLSHIALPLGSGPQLATWHPISLGASVLDALVERTGINAAEIDDVIVGCVSQAGAQASVFFFLPTQLESPGSLPHHWSRGYM
jgi:hypothetical protein